MTVSTTDWKKQYDGNGVTVDFPFPYPFLANSHITVIETVIATGVETTLALTTDYTITGAGNPAGGTITAVTAPASTKRWTILRIVPETQAADYNEGDAFPAAVTEQALDKLTMLVQQNARRIALSMRLADTDATGASVILPTPVALEILRWNAAATAIETCAAGSVDLAIPADDSVTLAKLAEMATDKLIGRSTAGTGNPEYIDLTAAGRALLDDVDASAQRTTLGLGNMALQSASAVAITGGSIGASVSLVAASETQAGVIEISNSSENRAWTEALKALTPYGLDDAFKGTNQDLTGTDFHQMFPGGLIVQWGTTSAGSGGYGTATFNMTFPTECQAIVAMTKKIGNSGGYSAAAALYEAPSTTACKISLANDDTAFYIAIGK